MKTISVTPPPAPPKFKRRSEMQRRMDALEAVRDRFEGKPFRLGTNDCAQLVRRMLREMGHPALPRPKPYTTELGARRELKRLGFDSLEALMDSLLPRIAPAAMLAGDIGLVDAEPAGGETLVVSLGHKFWGWNHDHDAMAPLEPLGDVIKAAWRV